MNGLVGFYLKNVKLSQKNMEYSPSIGLQNMLTKVPTSFEIDKYLCENLAIAFINFPIKK